MRLHRRAMVGTASALATLAWLAGATPAEATGAQAGTGVPPPATPAEVAKAFNASDIPAAIVVLVDMSESMSHGLYQRVQHVLPRFLGALATQGPRDQVAVITFGAHNDTQVIQPLGRPTRHINLPPGATDRGTDIGYAVQVALSVLGHAANFQEGGVLLLSDGKNNAGRDPAYGSYRSYGWRRLRRTLHGLGMQVTGYDLPLTNNPVDRADQAFVLERVFGSHRQQIPPDLANLGSQLQAAVSRGVMGRKVAARARPDIGHGVRVSWSVPGAAGTSPLNLRTGSADAQVTLTATTRRTPLYVTSLTATVSGFPVPVTATLPPTSGLIEPGHPLTLPVHLRWRAVSDPSALGAGPPPWPGRLTLTGQVRSTFSRAIKDYYRDSGFSVGGLTGAASTTLSATIAPPPPIFALVLIILVILALLAAGSYFLSRLGGTLTLTTVDDVSREPLLLPRRPWASARTEGLIGIPGTISVRGTPISKKMRIRLKLAQRPEGAGSLDEGGRTMLAGIDIVHDPGQVPADSSDDYQVD